MSDATNLPEDDRDLDLARRIGAEVEAGRSPHAPLAEADPALAEALGAWKRTPAESPSATISDRLWNQIHDRIESTATPLSLAPSRPPATRTARIVRFALAVAAVLALVVVGRVLLQPPVDAFHTVAESDDASVVYEAPDGSRITLRPHSTLSASRSDAREYRLEGEAFFDVAPDPERPFRAATKLGRVTVLGTRFNLSTWGEATRLYVEEGRVRFESLVSEETILLTAGEGSRVLSNGSLAPPAADAGAGHTDWLRAEMSFDRQPLSAIVAELEQHFAVRLEVPDTLAAETLSGRILLESREQAVRDLGLVVGGRFEATGPDAYRFVAE